MKRGFLLLLVITALCSNIAFAGAPKIEGEWVGSFVAIYNTGETMAIDGGVATIYQDDEYPNLFYGTMEFDMIIETPGGPMPITITRLLTGYIGEDKRISIQLTEQAFNPDYLPIPAIAVIEGHLTGNTIKGVVRDFTDTTTTMVIAIRQ